MRLASLVDAFRTKYDDFFQFRLEDGRSTAPGSIGENLVYDVRPRKAFGFTKGDTFRSDPLAVRWLRRASISSPVERPSFGGASMHGRTSMAASAAPLICAAISLARASSLTSTTQKAGP